jgi:moderate conductance mechanosensitive channel
MDLNDILLPVLGAPAADEAISFWTQAIDRAWRIALILVIGALVRWALGRAITAFIGSLNSSGTRLQDVTKRMSLKRRREMQQSQTETAALRALDARAADRREQRAHTLSAVLRNLASLVVWAVSAVMILDLLGINIGPVLASVGVLGLAISFGSQELIRDMVAGIFILAEDLIGVGDIVDLEFASGTVENVTLRTTQVRSPDGTLWTVRNGQIVSLGNSTQGFSNALVPIDISTRTDWDAAQEAIQAAIDALIAGDLAEDLLDHGSIGGIEKFDAHRYTTRATVKTFPGKAWGVQLELRRLIAQEFAARDLQLAEPLVADFLNAK